MGLVQRGQFKLGRVRGWLWAFMVLAGFWGVSRATAAEDFSRYVRLASDEPVPKVTMRIYNYAHVPEPLLGRAESEASTIFSRAGTTVEWLDCPLTRAEKAQFPACGRPFGAVDYVLNLLPESMARQAHLHDTAFGFAMLSSNGSRSFFASVIWDRIEESAEGAQGTGLSAYQLLGHAMAHEMGHLLLGSMSHTPTGLMSARWGPAEFNLIARGNLLFTVPQCQQMRAETLARIEKRKLLARRAEPGSNAH